MNDNNIEPDLRPTPLTDSSEYDGRIIAPRSVKVVRSDFARTLERSLAERTEERGKSYKFNQALADAMTIDRRSIVALNEENERLKRQLYTALAKLAKCKSTLEWVAESRSGHASTLARKTLEETK